MKKHITLFLLSSAIILGACSGNPKAQSAEEPAEIAAASVAVNPNEVKKDAEDSHGAVKLTKADFLTKVMNYEKNQTNWVFEGDKPALIDFYADWCAPCRITSPILDELAVEYGDKIDIYKIDTEAEQELAAVFGIRSLPSFLFVPKEGKPTMSAGIAQTPEETKQMFRDQIDELLLN